MAQSIRWYNYHDLAGITHDRVKEGKLHYVGPFKIPPSRSALSMRRCDRMLLAYSYINVT